MTTTTLIQLSPEELDQRIQNALEQALKKHLPAVEAAPTKKYLTIADVCEQLGYQRRTILTFIHDGRQARSGKIQRLPAFEITTNEYRILPSDLAKWVSYF